MAHSKRQFQLFGPGSAAICSAVTVRRWALLGALSLAWPCTTLGAALAQSTAAEHGGTNTTITPPASQALNLFDSASTLFVQQYYGWNTLDRAALVGKYRQQLTQQCAQQASCSYDTGRAALQAMFDEFHDDHTSVKDAQGALRLREIQENLSVPRTGLRVVKRAQGLLVVDVQQGSPAAQQHLAPGDLIQQVGGRVAGTGQSVDSQEFVRLERLGQPMTLRYEHLGQPLEVTLQPASMQAQDTPRLSFLQPHVALIALPSFLPTDSAQQFLSAVQQAKKQGAAALIIDLRYNTGGRLDQCVAAASIFKPVLYEARFEQGNWDFAGVQGVSALPLETQLSAAKSVWQQPAAVLVGPDTASCAEVFAFFAQKSGVQVVGESTKGVANSGINFFTLPDQGVLSLTMLRAYDSAGRALPSSITPDLVAPTDLMALVEGGQDTTLIAALSALDTHAVPTAPVITSALK